MPLLQYHNQLVPRLAPHTIDDQPNLNHHLLPRLPRALYRRQCVECPHSLCLRIGMYGRRAVQRDVSKWTRIVEQHQQRKSDLVQESDSCDDSSGADGNEKENSSPALLSSSPSPPPPLSLTRKRIQAAPPHQPQPAPPLSQQREKRSGLALPPTAVIPSLRVSSGNAFSVLMGSSAHRTAATVSQRKRKADSSSCSSTKSARSDNAPSVASVGSVESCSAPQLFLDFGQPLKCFTTCAQCGFVYQAGQATDEQLHKQRHELQIKGIAFNGWQDEPPNLLAILPPTTAKHSAQPADRLLRVDSSHLSRHPSHAAKVGEIVERLHQQLGSTRSAGDSYDTSPALTLLLTAGLSLYFYVRHKRVIAAMSVRSEVEAAPIIQSTSSSNSYQLSLSNRRTVAIGIEHIWVIERHRRDGVASRMLDACRMTHVYVAQHREDIAFSQPTTAGRQLAQHYTGRQDFLAYG